MNLPKFLRATANNVQIVKVRCAAYAERILIAMGHLARRPVNYSWGAAAFQVPFVIVGLLYFQAGIPDIPTPVGIAIGALGFAAVLVALRGEHLTGIERVGWAIIAALLLVAEIRAIYRDQAAAEARYQSTLASIQNSMAQSDRNFTATMNAMKEDIKTLTGDDSFCYVVLYSFRPGHFGVAVTHRGDYPMYAVDLRIIDTETAKKLKGQVMRPESGSGGKYIPVGDFPAGINTRFLTVEVEPENPDTAKFNVFLDARNGLFVELLRMKRVRNKWESAIKVMKIEGGNSTLSSGRYRTIFTEVTKSYPRTNGKVEWEYSHP